LTFVIDAFGHQHDAPRAECGLRVIGDFEVICYRGGTGRILVDRTWHEVRGGSLVILPPYLPHEIRTVASDPHDNYWIHFDLDETYEQDALAGLLLPTASACVTTASTSTRTLMEAIAAQMLTTPPGYRAAAEGLLVALVAELIRSVYDPSAAVPAPLDGRRASMIRRALRFITTHLADDISVPRLCAEAGCGKSLLHELFRERFGEAPMHVVRWARLRQAERLLRSTDLTVTEISARVGIASAFHLSSLFRDRYGMAPSRYREQTRYL
jgi:AraC-like DNA-binding protein